MPEHPGLQKRDLAPLEKIKAAYFNLCRGIDQHIIADMFDVNQGRVSEAVTEIKQAVGLSP